MTVTESYLGYFLRSFCAKEEPSTYHLYIPGQVNDIAIKRTSKITETVWEYAKKLDFPHPMCVLAARTDCKPLIPYLAEAEYQNDYNMYVNFSYLFLIEPDDIPKELRINSEEDPRLASDAYIDEFAQWISKFLGSKPIKPDLAERETVRGFLKLSLHPEKLQKIKEFTLAHEVSHLYHRHSLKSVNSCQRNNNISKIGGLTFGAAAIGAAKLLSYSLFPMITIGTSTLLVSKFVLNRLLDSRDSRRDEKEADLTACKIVGAEGGIYGFKFSKQHMLSLRNQKHSCLDSALLKMMITSQGGSRFAIFDDHPNDDERLKYLEAQQKK